MKNVIVLNNNFNSLLNGPKRKVHSSLMTIKNVNIKNNFNSYSEHTEIERTLLNNNHKNLISHESIVAFIIDYGIKIQEDETHNRLRLMLTNHKIIEFYGVKYFIPMFKFNFREEKVFKYLIENN